MVKTIVGVARGLRVATLELAGAGLLVTGASKFSVAAGFVVAGVCVLGKSLELDLRDQARNGE